MDFVMFSTHDFDFIRTRKQHVAINLAILGHRVLYIEPPRAGKWGGIPLTRHNLLIKKHDNLYIYKPPVFPFMGSFNVINDLNYRYIAYNIKHILEKLNFKDYIFWNYPLRGFILLKYINPYKVVFDCIENWPYSNEAEWLKDKLSEFLKECDIVFAPSQEIVDFCLKYNDKSYLIPHGVNPIYLKHNNYSEPTDVINIQHPRIGISSSISKEWVDVELIKDIAIKRKDWNILIIGPIMTGNSIDEWKGISNIYYLGVKKPEDLPAYLFSFDVGLIPFKVNYFTRCIRPLKFFDYLASGLPIVSTPLRELMEYKRWVLIGKDSDKIINHIETALDSNLNTERRVRIEEAKRHLWKFRIKDMLTYLQGVF